MNTQPTAPVLEIVSVGHHTAEVTWTYSESDVGMSHYVLYNNNEIEFTSFDALTNDVQMLELEPGMDYVLYVIGVDIDGVASEPSNQVTVVTKAHQFLPAKPTITAHQMPDDSYVAVSWMSFPLDNSDGYIIYRDGGVIYAEDNWQDLSELDTTTVSGSTYSYTAIAYNSMGNSEMSEPVSITVS